MTDEVSLQGLVERSVALDAAAFRALIETLDGKLFRYVSSRTNSREEAIDILQDTFIALWHALPRFEYRSDAGFYRFVYTITKRHLSKVGSTRSLPLPDPDMLPDDAFLQEAPRNADVALALKKLGDTARDIVVLRHWSEFSFKEIGAMLSMKEEAVRVRHHRALSKLRELLPLYA
ncbi:MAG TPA: sigma-70 family RNA polymerase sigma factor [Candidatus Paceibacterota bacterium]|nr:sigma-70 family RNA polymerase sigma factor [Candidatus Paceibacterota bacterium]